MLKEDRRDCVNALLTSGADVSIPNHESETPLHIAIPVGNYGLQTSTYKSSKDILYMLLMFCIINPLKSQP